MTPIVTPVVALVHLETLNLPNLMQLALVPLSNVWTISMGRLPCVVIRVIVVFLTLIVLVLAL